MPASLRSWDRFLQSPAISFARPEPQKPTGSSDLEKRCPREYYWHRELLERWVGVYPTPTCADGGEEHFGVSTISYGAHMLLASFLAKSMRCRLSLAVQSQETFVESRGDGKNSSTLRVGIAIPEGPFLPLLILAVHSLNVSVGEDWLLLDDTNGSMQSLKRCMGVVIIPMETDEAPERLKHILGDSSPNLILVAPGRDWDSMENALRDAAEENKPQLVDFVQLTEEAISSLHTHIHQNDSHSLLQQLWPQGIRIDSMDALQYPQTISECFDVVKLIALGSVRLANSFSIDALSRTGNLPSKREIVSHVVYTSGTTGKPKGCVSSLASLQHYIRAKNLAHSIDGGSRVLLASAITFDPCFSDILATCVANAVLCIAPRERIHGHDDSIEHGQHGSYGGLTKLMRQLEVSHILCTPTLWATVEGSPPDNIPSLKVVALGGEHIPKAMIGRWARSRTKSEKDEYNRQYPRLFATYGVTEACVYQTFGEVVMECDDDFCNDMEKARANRPGQSVGLPLLGTNIHICHPCREDEGVNDDMALKPMKRDVNSSEPIVGEVVLSGEQVDAVSSYLNLSQLTARVFVKRHGGESGLGRYSYFYRTGDLGYIEPNTGILHLLGRIKGDGMIKINGIRIELAEVQNAVIDDALKNSEEGSLVVDCLAAVTTNSSTGSDDVQHNKQLVAYCILSAASISQLGISPQQLKRGIIVPPGPLLSLLRARCDRRVRKGCTPSFFALIDRLPLSPTGKRDRSALPPLASCSILKSSNCDKDSLWNRGGVGSFVATKICECLNLQHCQRQLVTCDATFSALGGDSLTATRVVRGLYAQYHGVLDSRNLGGATGTLDGAFAAKYLLQSHTLGEYVKFLESRLDSQSAFEKAERSDDRSNDNSQDVVKKATDPMYESLLEAITLGYTAVASSLLDLGVNPNSQPSQGRLGKVTNRKHQRSLFKSNPLHLACSRGDQFLVGKLLSKGCKPNCPDATGSFPIHLACSRSDDQVDKTEEDLKRQKCVELLLGSGRTPISIKDGNKQTILHSAARSGHCKLLQYIMCQWKVAAETTGIKFKSHNNIPGRIYDWYDRWFRTPVHWATLNGRTSALRILLDGGCSASPPKPKSGVSKRSTGVIIETPIEMCLRLYGDADGIGKEISCLLRNAKF